MITIVVPFYNAEQYIGRCCESLITQKGDFEFILVDDKSKDSSHDIACDYANKDKRITVVSNKYKKGVSGARNTGIEAADGEWVTFLDVDDEMLPNACDTFHRVILTADANVHQLNHMRYYTSIDKLTLKYWNHGGEYDAVNMPKCWYGAWNKIIKTEFLKDIRFDESLQYGEDGLFVLECLAKENRIHHAEKDLTVVKHRFDNVQSLSHIKGAKDLIRQVHAYEKFMLRQTDPDIKTFVCEELSRLWDSDVFKGVFKA